MGKELLLRSSWQDVNIGDIAHTPALLAILEKRLPEVKVTVWASMNTTEPVIAMIRRRFPDVEFVRGDRSVAQVRAAMLRADFMLHGSGPYLVGAPEVRQYLDLTGGKYGAFGITYREQDDVGLLDRAEFLYFRDGVSLACARAAGICARRMEFGPDAAFATDLADEERAADFLSESGLTPHRYVCCIPRLRITPYWRIRSESPYKKDADELNDRYKEQDHRYLRAAILRILDNTDLKVLVCPEDETQMAVGKELIVDRLPERYRARLVLRRRFWLTDEALSVYRKSLALFGNEMHSPILCIGNAVPALVCRWQQQTSKGFMWNDIGLGDWLFDSDAGIDDDVFADAVMDVIGNRERSIEKTVRARDFVNRCYDRMTDEIRVAMQMDKA